MTLRIAALAWTLAIAGACSGSSNASGPANPDDVETGPQLSPEEQKRQEALQRLQARQEAACEQVGPPLIQCAVEDAQANLSAEELAELDIENTAPRLLEDFLGKCKSSEMSLRQIKVFEGCMANTACDVFVDCLDAAQPKADAAGAAGAGEAGTGEGGAGGEEPGTTGP